MFWKNNSTLLHLLRFLPLLLSLGNLGCGYTFQTSRNTYSDEGLETVFIQHLSNGTGQSGVEVVVYNSLLRALLARGRWKVVASESSADVILSGSVVSAGYSVGNLQQIQSLQPGLGRFFSAGLANIPVNTVAQSYNAALGCQFTLKLNRPKAGQSPILWANTFSRVKAFPSANQLDVPGTTSPLINQSEFERALTDMSTWIAADAEESMFSRF